MALASNTVLTKNEEKFLASDLGDEMVMMDLESGNYIGLNEVGKDIWLHITGETTVSELIAKLVEEYEVTAEECEKDVMEYLEGMLEKRMVLTK